jgi:hypothetical protein
LSHIPVLLALLVVTSDLLDGVPSVGPHVLSSSNFMMPRFHFEYKLNFLIPEQGLAAQLLVFISSVWLVHIVFNNLLPVTISLHDLHDPTVLICWSDYLSVTVSSHGTCTLLLQTHQLDLPVGKLPGGAHL